MLFNQSETIGELSQAIANAYGDLSNSLNDAKGAFKNDYASLASVVGNGNRQVLARNGIAIIQGLKQENRVAKETEDDIGVTREFQPYWQLLTRLQHKSGEYIEFATPLPMEEGGRMSAPHKFMSAVTYMRRCSNGLVTNTATDNDDDGNAASDIDGLFGSKGGNQNQNKKSTPKSEQKKADVKNTGKNGSSNSAEIKLPDKEKVGPPLEAKNLKALMAKLSNIHWESSHHYMDHVRAYWEQYKAIAEDVPALQKETTELKKLLEEAETQNPYPEIA